MDISSISVLIVFWKVFAKNHYRSLRSLRSQIGNEKKSSGKTQGSRPSFGQDFFFTAGPYKTLICEKVRSQKLSFPNSPEFGNGGNGSGFHPMKCRETFVPNMLEVGTEEKKDRHEAPTAFRFPKYPLPF